MRLPKKFNTTLKKFKVQKRKEFDDVIKAYRKFHYGAHYTPLGEEAMGMCWLLEGLQKRLSQKNWGK